MDILNTVSVFLLLIIQAHALVLNPPSTLNGTSNRVSLRNAVLAEVVHITQTYRYTTFRELEATSIHATANPDDLDDVRLIFKGDAAHPKIIVSMVEWGIWGPPESVEETVPMEEEALPYRLRLDVRDADAIMKQAGFSGRYVALDVRKFVVHGVPLQPWWIFLMEDDQPFSVWVGDWLGDVVPDWEASRLGIKRNGSLSTSH